MLIGILSDSHDRHLPVRQAIALFDKLGVEHVIHCGDIGGMEVFDEMLGRPLAFVWGNMDFPDTGLYAYLDTADLKPLDDGSPITQIDGKRIAVFHGHESLFHRAIEHLDVDYLFHGHTHVVRDERVGGKRIINPGALHRAARKTVATLDVELDKLIFHEIRDG